MKTEFVYLLHFEPRFKHAQHYLGSAIDPHKRFELHATGRSGVKLITYAYKAGVRFTLARLWRGGRNEERRMKGRSLRPLCPICNPTL